MLRCLLCWGVAVSWSFVSCTSGIIDSTDASTDQGQNEDSFNSTDDGATNESVVDETAGADDQPDAGENPGDTTSTDNGPVPAFSFVVFGDNQFDPNQCFYGTARMAIPKAVLELNPDFVLTAGDNLDDGKPYQTLKDCYQEMLASIPFFPTAGNHDCLGIEAYKTYLQEQLLTTNAAVWGSTYAQDFTMYINEGSPDLSTTPSGFSHGTYYAFKYKNAYFISFEQGTRWWTNTPKSWLEHHLQQARSDPSIQHIFAYMHNPMYSTTMAFDNTGECTKPVRDAYEPLFRQYNVTMAFAGHAHLYDRFYVPDDGSNTRQVPPPATYPYRDDAVHYIVTGGAGGGLNGCGAETEPGLNYSQGRDCSNHVTQVTVEGRKLTVRIIKVTGNENSHTTSEINSFVIE